MVKSESSKLNFVRNLKKSKNLGGKSGGNYWSIFKSAVIKLHKGIISIDDFLQLPSKVHFSDKANYLTVTTAYNNFIKDNLYDWTKPISGLLILGNIGIKITPHLGLIVNGQKVNLMLYVRKYEPLTPIRACQILTIMKNGLQSGADYSCWLLDVISGNLYTGNDIDQKMIPFLEQEANDFELKWNKI